MDPRSRREFERKEFYGHIEGVTEGSSFYATIRDLSLSGMCLEADYILKTGANLLLRLRSLERGPDPLELKAEVVWVQPLKMLMHRIGVRFTELMPKTKSIIKDCFFQTNPSEIFPERSYPLLSSPFKVSNITLKNRLTMAPMFWGYAEEDGTVSQPLIDHYREVALGGVSMVVVANAVVDPAGIMGARVLRIDHDRFIPGLAKLAAEIEEAGAVACLQLNHGGAWAKVEKPLAPSPVSLEVPSELALSGTFRKDLSGREQIILVNEFLSRLMKGRRSMSINEIESTREAFCQAALRAKKAGFRMIELHGATGYLLAQFISPRSNRRSDRYGGNINKRMRFAREVIEGVKAAVGDSVPVGYRFLASEWLPGGLDLQEAKEFAKHLQDMGVGYLSVTAGTYESFFLPRIMNECRNEAYIAPYAQEIKEAAPKIPIIAAGRIVRPESAERIIRDNATDLIGLARTLFADPSWPKKVFEGRQDEIIFCTSCNTCFHHIIRDEPAICARWDKMKKSDLHININKKRSKWGKVLIAMDDSANSLQAVKYVAQMIPQARKVTLFSVLLDEYGAEELRERMESLMLQAKGILSGTGFKEDDIEVKIVPKRNNVSEDIMEEIKNGEYGSIIVGRRGISRVQRLLFGSVSNHIVGHAKGCAVWVID